MSIQYANETEEKISVLPPKKYSVLFHNDDYTPMDFVVILLTQIFQKNTQDAVQVMLHIHNNGMAVVGVYSYDIAQTKKGQAEDMATQEGHPLKITLEEVRE